MLIKKPSKFDFDIIVIGSGAGGSVAAQTLAVAGKRVGLIEAKALGGASLNTTSIPTTALYDAAKALQDVQSAQHHGIRPGSSSFRYASVLQSVEQAVASAKPRDEQAYSHPNIHILHGQAHFVSPYVVSVGLRRYSARSFVIATGTVPHAPSVAGLSETPHLSYRDMATLDTLPDSLAIIGGGPSGYQYAHIFATFGVRVHLFEKLGHLLPHEDSEVGDLTAASLARKGVRVHVGVHILTTKGDNKRVVVEFRQHGLVHRISTERLLVAAGTDPAVDLGLENTGVRYDASGIKVDRTMRTNIKHIYAVGDSTGARSAAAAIQSAHVAAHNLLHRKHIGFDTHAIPRIALGMPQVASVGKTEHELKWSGVPYQTAIAPLGIIARATGEPYASGFVKVIATQHGFLLGASVVAANASEMLPELSLAVRKGLRACDVANTIHAFPSWTEAIRVACAKIRCI